MNWQNHIEQRPDVLAGKPVFKGTRIAVQMILQELAAGSTETELLAAYQTLRPDHLRAAYDYAAKVISLDESIFASSPGR